LRQPRNILAMSLQKCYPQAANRGIAIVPDFAKARMGCGRRLAGHLKANL
jgi:hypothetical protein